MFTHRLKETTNTTIMGYVREKRILAAAEQIRRGSGICSAAMEYGFETHAGFTKAFSAIFGCCPKDYAAHCRGKHWKGYDTKNESMITIRPIAPEDVNDLRENVYSAMTPKDITEIWQRQRQSLCRIGPPAAGPIWHYLYKMSVCTVDLLTPKAFAVCRTVALESMINSAMLIALSSI